MNFHHPKMKITLSKWNDALYMGAPFNKADLL